MRLLIASSNKGKLVEIMDLLQDVPVDAILPADIGLELDVAEDGKTYAENALKKALAYCSASGLTTLADDSGLEVAVLGGKPGLHSARFSGKLAPPMPIAGHINGAIERVLPPLDGSFPQHSGYR